MSKEQLTEYLYDDHISSVLQILAKECYKNAKDHGFWDDEDDLLSRLSTDKINEDNRREKRIIGLFNAEKIALEHSELSERLECIRKDPERMDEHCPKFLNLEIEVADELIRALDFCGRRGLRIGEAVIAKMKYNKSRPYMHGKKF